MPATQRPTRVTPSRIPSFGVILRLVSFTGNSPEKGRSKGGWRIDSRHPTVRPFSGFLRRFPVEVRTQTGGDPPIEQPGIAERQTAGGANHGRRDKQHRRVKSGAGN